MSDDFYEQVRVLANRFEFSRTVFLRTSAARLIEDLDPNAIVRVPAALSGGDSRTFYFFKSTKKAAAGSQNRVLSELVVYMARTLVDELAPEERIIWPPRFEFDYETSEEGEKFLKRLSVQKVPTQRRQLLRSQARNLRIENRGTSMPDVGKLQRWIGS